MNTYINYSLQGIVALSAVLSEHMLAKEKLSGWTLAIFASALAAIFF
ncbi:MAG: hypothetical protein QG566_741 [Patescibacteria group bacterium]|jgi:hypothetical protein|nr:hypothetical protein [Patescibacteria group bacterium]